MDLKDFKNVNTNPYGWIIAYLKLDFPIQRKDLGRVAGVS